MTGFRTLDDGKVHLMKVGVDAEHRRKQVTIDDPSVFDGFLGAEELPPPVSLFYRLTTYEYNLQRAGHLPAAISDIPGAGYTTAHPDLPAVLLLPNGAPASCLACTVGARGFGPPILSGALLLVPFWVISFRRTRWRCG